MTLKYEFDGDDFEYTPKQEDIIHALVYMVKKGEDALTENGNLLYTFLNEYIGSLPFDAICDEHMESIADYFKDDAYEAYTDSKSMDAAKEEMQARNERQRM